MKRILVHGSRTYSQMSSHLKDQWLFLFSKTLLQSEQIVSFRSPSSVSTLHSRIYEPTSFLAFGARKNLYFHWRLLLRSPSIASIFPISWPRHPSSTESPYSNYPCDSFSDDSAAPWCQKVLLVLCSPSTDLHSTCVTSLLPRQRSSPCLASYPPLSYS